MVNCKDADEIIALRARVAELIENRDGLARGGTELLALLNRYRDFVRKLLREGGPLSIQWWDGQCGNDAWRCEACKRCGAKKEGIDHKKGCLRQRARALPGAQDGAPVDGFFWRDGERWLRERGREFRLLDLAPHLEADWRRRHPAESAKHTDPDCECARKAQEGRP